jgi:hypothetical protein
MGVVFRATDLRLERSVALKFLSPEVAAGTDFRDRFIRESRLAAAIEHPAIVPVYEAGESDGILYIAMRYVPGHDLGSILRREAPLDRARTLTIARSVADALDAAHRRGLVHRDVKPGNVLVEQDGDERAYLADFGLTRRLGELTSPGRSGPLGTLDYVAPEQIAQRPLDGRADQYALACLVFHCLTGSPPFEADTDAAVLYGHLHGDRPRPSRIGPDLPESLDAPMHRALSRDPDDRFPDCRGFVDALAGPSADVRSGAAVAGAGARPPSGTVDPTRRRGRKPLVVVAAAGMAIVLGVLLSGGIPPPGDGVPLSSAVLGGDPAPAGPADLLEPRPGEVVVFASDTRGDYDLYALEGGRDVPRRLTRTARDERSPAVSPDGTTIAYVVGREPDRDIWLMDADGGRQRRLTSDPADDMDPAWSEDGRSLAFASSRTGFYDIYEIRDRGSGLDERNARNLTDRPALEHFPEWAPSGRRLAIASNHFGGNRNIVGIDADDPSVLLARTSTSAFDFQPSWAPDGRSIAFYRRPYCLTCPATRGPADLWVMGARGERPRRLTSTPARDEIEPDWAPDGRAIVYAGGSAGSREIFLISPDGRLRRQLTRGWADAVEPAWGVAPAAPLPSSSPTRP